MNLLLQNIINNVDVRKSLSDLRKAIKVEANKRSLYEVISKDTDRFIELLKSEDAKTRKNVSLLLGDLKMQESLDSLMDAYKNEQQRFVKSSYLDAIKELDYDKYLEEFKLILKELLLIPLEDNNKKHIQEEIKSLNNLIIAKEGIKKHEFVGFRHKYDIILITNREFKDITLNQITNGSCKEMAAGVRVTTKDVLELLDIRTYSELLFIIEGMRVCEIDANSAGETIVKSKLIDTLNKMHGSDGPYYFRLDIKAKMDLEKKSNFAKKLANIIEMSSNRQLINSTSNYEIEIRLIQNKEGRFNLLLKNNNLRDDRFNYRKEFMPTSIKPVNAALLVEISKEYMKNDARVLDPFCGVGTMLIERQKVVKANTSYGIDIHEEAIEKAKLNTEAAGQVIYYVNRDIESFTHEYAFDEIFTHMPFAQGHIGLEEIYITYKEFFKKAKTLLSEDGIIIMYTHDEFFVNKCIEEYGYEIIDKHIIHKKEGTDLIILKAK